MAAEFIKLVRENPSVFKPLLGLIITVIAKFGFDLDAESVLVVLAAVGTVVTWWVRRSVTPQTKLENNIAVDGSIIENARKAAITTSMPYEASTVTVWEKRTS